MLDLVSYKVHSNVTDSRPSIEHLLCVHLTSFNNNQGILLGKETKALEG